MADIKKIKIGNDELDVTKKQDKIDSTHKLSSDLVDDSSSTHKFTTAADISKLSGIEAGAEVNVQPDWSQTTTTADDYIKNKPTIPTVGSGILTIQKNSSNIDTFSANATANKTINITVPTTAADVSALPASTKYGASISVSINSTDYKITTTLKDQDGNTLGTAQVIDLPLESVVVNGSFDSINKKIVLTLENGNTVDIPVGDLVAGLQTEITSSSKLASDLVDDTGQTNKFMTSAEKTKLSGIAAGAEVNVQSDWNQTTTTADDYIKNKPTLATVATSGSYNDLSNKPTIPTVNNATLTIQKNGTTVKTFTANASTNVTANITVPTKTSDLTNDSNYITNTTYASANSAGVIKVGNNLSISNGVLSAAGGTSYTEGSHIDITNDVISAVDYVHSDDPVATSEVTPVVTNSMIANGTITADKIATGEVLKLTLSTSDIGEGAALAANTLYGVYE